MKLLNRNDEKLAATLTEAQKETFEKYKDCNREISEISEREIFLNGFRLGARIIIDVALSRKVCKFFKNHKKLYFSKALTAGTTVSSLFKMNKIFLSKSRNVFNNLYTIIVNFIGEITATRAFMEFPF